MIADQLSLEEKVVIITGGSTGLGRAIALAMGRAGANLVIAARRIEALEEVAEELRAMSRRAIAIPTDVTDSTQVDSMVRRCISEFGSVDVLINNAGGCREYFDISPLDLTDEQWHRGIDAELSGAFYCCRAVGRHMMTRGSGKIINVSSLLGMVGQTSTYLQIPYSIGKAAVIQLTKSLATLWAGQGININCIAAGFIGTRFSVPDMDPGAMNAAGRFIPIGRIGKPDEIGPLAVFLASQASDYITGEIFVFDGGSYAGRFSPVWLRPNIPLKRGTKHGVS